MPPSELGTFFSLVSVCQALLPSVMSPVASVIYNNTLDWFPGTWALAPAALMLVMTATFGLTFAVMRHDSVNVDYRPM